MGWSASPVRRSCSSDAGPSRRCGGPCGWRARMPFESCGSACCGYAAWLIIRLALTTATITLVEIFGTSPSETTDRLLLAGTAVLANALAYPMLGCLDVMLLLEAPMPPRASTSRCAAPWPAGGYHASLAGNPKRGDAVSALTRAWNEIVAGIADLVRGGVPTLVFLSFVAALLVALGWYFWPAWLPWHRRLRDGEGERRTERRTGWRGRFRIGALRWRLRRRRRKSRAEEEPLDLPDDVLPDLPAEVLALTADQSAAAGRYAEADGSGCARSYAISLSGRAAVQSRMDSHGACRRGRASAATAGGAALRRGRSLFRDLVRPTPRHVRRRRSHAPPCRCDRPRSRRFPGDRGESVVTATPRPRGPVAPEPPLPPPSEPPLAGAPQSGRPIRAPIPAPQSGRPRRWRASSGDSVRGGVRALDTHCGGAHVPGAGLQRRRHPGAGWHRPAWIEPARATAARRRGQYRARHLERRRVDCGKDGDATARARAGLPLSTLRPPADKDPGGLPPDRSRPAWRPGPAHHNRASGSARQPIRDRDRRPGLRHRLRPAGRTRRGPPRHLHGASPTTRCYGGSLIGFRTSGHSILLVGATDPFRNDRIGEARQRSARHRPAVGVRPGDLG